ncbi:hypothetical protein ACNF49_52720 [Actinomadura sp. ATCC 39365]
MTAPDPSWKDAVGRPAGVLVSPPVTVTAYGPQDHGLRQEEEVAFGPLGRGGD